MTYRLTPVGSRGGAEVIFGGMFVQVIVYQVIDDVA